MLKNLSAPPAAGKAGRRELESDEYPSFPPARLGKRMRMRSLQRRLNAKVAKSNLRLTYF
jgi:hypothetical protein